MKIKYLIVLIVVLVFSVGCSGKEASIFEQGQKALENHEYDKAQDYLSEALEENPKNDSARSMYMQAVKMSKAEDYKDRGFYEEGIECLERIVNIDNGSQKIKVEANELKKELEALEQKEEEAANIRKANAKEVAKKDMQKSEEQFYAWRQNQAQDDTLDQSGSGDLGDFLGVNSGNFLDSVKNKITEIFNL